MKFNNIWLCEPGHLKRYLEFVSAKSISETIPIGESDTEAPQANTPEASAPRQNKSMSRAGRTAVISVVGILSEDGPSWIGRYFGIQGTSYRDIREAIQIANTDDTYDDIVMVFDTPGGDVLGVDETWGVIKNSRKTVNSEVRGMLASGGYYLASATNKIIATSPSSWIGSIGVVVTDVDDREYFEKNGIYVVEVTSDNAPKKRMSPLTTEGKSELKKTVNAFERIFHQRISEGRNVSRKDIIKNYGQGAMFVAFDPDSKELDALNRGMIDNVLNGFSTKIKGLSVGKKEAAISQEEKAMNLEEFLKENPEAREELHAKISAAITEERNRCSRAFALVQGGEYGKPVQQLAVRVACGEIGIDALEAAVTVLDEQKTSAQIGAAIEEQDNTGTVTAIAAPMSKAPSKPGQVNSDDDVEAAAKALY